MNWLEDVIDYDVLCDLSVDAEKRYIAELERKQAQKLVRQAEVLFLVLVALGIEEIEESQPVSLPLPAAIHSVAADRLYGRGCAYGRLWYRMDQYTVDEDTLETVRRPGCSTRQEIGDFLTRSICCDDPQVVAALPLGYRVGVVVGWLSALAVTQKEDAQAGMVVLAALVTPLLLSEPGKSHRGQLLPAPVKKSRRVKRHVTKLSSGRK